MSVVRLLGALGRDQTYVPGGNPTCWRATEARGGAREGSGGTKKCLLPSRRLAQGQEEGGEKILDRYQLDRCVLRGTDS